MDGVLLFEHASDTYYIQPNQSLTNNRLNIALELAKNNPVYEDIASKFFEVRILFSEGDVTHISAQHFIFIADAMTYKTGDNEESLWNEEDGMYYDAISFSPGNVKQLPVRSLVGLIPMYAVLVLEPSVINRLPGFKKRMEWFIENRPEMSERNMANMKGMCTFSRVFVRLVISSFVL